MRNTYKLIALLLLALSANLEGQTKADYAKLTDQIATYITEEKADSVVRYFDSTMIRSISPNQLSDSWDLIGMKYGKYLQRESPQLEQRDIYFIATQLLVFEKGKMTLRITFNQRLQVAGLFILPYNADQYNLPGYVNSVSFVEHKISFGKAPIILEGMLSIKQTEKRLPLVIILQGSGPQDMDGTYGSNKIYKDIAWGIASNEIAVFRYPKRTSIYGSLYLAGDPKQRYNLEDEYVNDVLMILEILRKRPDIDTNQIYIFGHSQGGDAAIIAAQKSGKINGLIMASTSPRPIQELMCEQLDYINGYEPPYSEKRIRSEQLKQKLVYSLRPDLKYTDPFDSLPLNIAPSYWMYLNQFKPVESLQSMPQLKLLFLQGKRDYQVTIIDFNLWKAQFANNPNASFILYPKLNHMYFKGEARSTAAEYEERHSVDEAIINDVVKWVKKK